MYWGTSNLWSIMQARLLRSARVRTALKLPALPVPSRAVAAAQAAVVDSAKLAAAAAKDGKKVPLFDQPRRKPGYRPQPQSQQGRSGHRRGKARS